MKRIFGMVFLVLFLSANLFAQETDLSAIESKIAWDPLEINIYEFSDIPQEKVDLIIALIVESGTITNLQNSFRKMYSSLGEDQKVKIIESLNIHRIVELMIPIYNRHYTEVDLQQIVGFYKSPSGKKMLESGPKITQEAISVTANYFQSTLKL